MEGMRSLLVMYHYLNIGNLMSAKLMLEAGNTLQIQNREW